MTPQSKRIVDKAWTFSHVLRDDGLSYMAYTEQITFLLFLKMADEMSRKHPERPSLVPKGLSWQTLLDRQESDLIAHYELILESLSRKPGMLGAIFQKPRPDIQNPETLRRLIVDLIEPVDWSAMDADVKGDIYEGILARSADESPKGAGQYFTPRPLVQAIVECVNPGPDDTVCDPAAGTGGFLLAAHAFAQRRPRLTPAQRRHLADGFARGWELVPNTGRLCVMNLYLHGIESDACPIEIGVDSLVRDPKERFSVVMTNPPFGRKSTTGSDIEAAAGDNSDRAYQRKDFWASTNNKQLNFLQHAHTLLASRGKCAIVIPDNVLFEGGAGETVRRALLQDCDVHTLLRLPTGIFYAQGVKANVLFFDAKSPSKKPSTTRLWVYDLRSGMRFTLKTRSIQRSDLDEFVTCFRAETRSRCKAAWDADRNPRGRWRSFDCDDLLKRDKANLDLAWLSEDGSSGASDGGSADHLAQTIIEDLQGALLQFQAVAKQLSENTSRPGMAPAVGRNRRKRA